MKKKTEKKAIVTKRNELNELKLTNATLQELRFFCIYLSKINRYDKSSQIVHLTLEEFQRIMGYGRLNIKQIEETVAKLQSRRFKVIERHAHGSIKRNLVILPTVDLECDVDGIPRSVVFKPNAEALEYLFDYKDRYFRYELWNTLSLKSANQIRMYEIMKQYEYLGKIELSIKELRELLYIDENEYQRFERFRTKVIDSCQQALKENTDICYTYERGQVGRGGKWLTIIFYISKNNDYKAPLSLSGLIEQQPVIKIEPTSETQEPIKTNRVDVVDLCTDEDNSKENNVVDDDTISFTVLDYEGELAKILAECSDYIYSPAQITVLQDMITEIAGQDYQTCKMYFLRKINLMKLYEEKKRKSGERIGSHFAYLYRMIENDINFGEQKSKKKNNEDTNTNSSFDIDDLDDLAMFDD